jgi:flagellar hook-associated protein 3 FlgL
MSQPAAAIGQQLVQTDEGQTTPIGLLASANSFVTSGGGSTTGSYMRDLMRALATIGSMSSGQATDPQFTALVQDTTTSLNSVVSAMASDAGVLGNRQTALTGIQTQLSDTATALTGQISSVQDVDMAATLSNLTALQTQLQASYRLISGEGSLSLVNFLPAG